MDGRVRTSLYLALPGPLLISMHAFAALCIRLPSLSVFERKKRYRDAVQVFAFCCPEVPAIERLRMRIQQENFSLRETHTALPVRKFSA